MINCFCTTDMLMFGTDSYISRSLYVTNFGLLFLFPGLHGIIKAELLLEAFAHKLLTKCIHYLIAAHSLHW